MNEKEKMTMMINVQVFVHSMIGMVKSFANNSDRLSPMMFVKVYLSFT